MKGGVKLLPDFGLSSYTEMGYVFFKRNFNDLVLSNVLARYIARSLKYIAFLFVFELETRFLKVRAYVK